MNKAVQLTARAKTPKNMISLFPLIALNKRDIAVPDATDLTVKLIKISPSLRFTENER